MKHFPESEFIINADGSVFHLHLQPEQLRDKIIGGRPGTGRFGRIVFRYT